MRPAQGTLCVLLAVLCLAGLTPARAETTTLRLGLPVPFDTPTGQNMREFARQVSARTSGALKIELQGDERRFEEQDVVPAVAMGEIQIGAAPLVHFTKDVPICAAFLQPFLFNFDSLVEAATRSESEIRTLIDNEILRRTGTRVLWWEPYGSNIIISRKAPVSDPVSIVVRPVGAPDTQTSELLSACGSLPQRLTPTETYSGLQQGTIAAAATDIMHVREHEFWRVADTITNLQHAPSLFMVVINAQVWDKLEPEHQVILTELAQDAQSYMWARFVTVRADAYAYAVEKGMRIVPLRSEDVTAWRACSASLLETYLDRAGVAGSRLFAAYGRLRTNPCCNEAPAEMSFMPQ